MLKVRFKLPYLDEEVQEVVYVSETEFDELQSAISCLNKEAFGMHDSSLAEEHVNAFNEKTFGKAVFFEGMPHAEFYNSMLNKLLTEPGNSAKGVHEDVEYEFFIE